MLLFMLVLLAGCKDSEDGAEKDAGAGELGTQDNLEETKKMNEQGNSAGGGQQSKTEQQGLQELPEQDNDFAGKQQQNEGKEKQDGGMGIGIFIGGLGAFFWGARNTARGQCFRRGFGLV